MYMGPVVKVVAFLRTRQVHFSLDRFRGPQSAPLVRSKRLCRRIRFPEWFKRQRLHGKTGNRSQEFLKFLKHQQVAGANRQMAVTIYNITRCSHGSPLARGE